MISHRELEFYQEPHIHPREWNPRSISITILRNTNGHTLDDWKAHLEQICNDLDCYCPEIQILMLEFAITIEEGIKLAEQKLSTG